MGQGRENSEIYFLLQVTGKPYSINGSSNFIQEVHLQNLEKGPSPSEMPPNRIFREIKMFTIPTSSASIQGLFYCHNTLPICQGNRYRTVFKSSLAAFYEPTHFINPETVIHSAL